MEFYGAEDGKATQSIVDASLGIGIPVVLALLVCVVLGLIVYFKRKKKKEMYQRRPLLMGASGQEWQPEASMMLPLSTMDSGSGAVKKMSVTHVPRGTMGGQEWMFRKSTSSDKQWSQGEMINPLSVQEEGAEEEGEQEIELEIDIGEVELEEELDINEVMGSALALVESATLELDQATATILESAEVDVADDLTRLKGAITEMQEQMQGEGTHLVDLAQGTAAIMQEIEDKIALSPEVRRQNLAVAKVKGLLQRSEKDLAYAAKAMGGESGLGVNKNYVIEQIVDSCLTTEGGIAPVAEDFMDDATVDTLGALATLLKSSGEQVQNVYADIASSQGDEWYVQTFEYLQGQVDAALKALPAEIEGASADLENMLNTLKRARAQLKHVKRRGSERVHRESVSSELQDIMKARRAGLKWKMKRIDE